MSQDGEDTWPGGDQFDDADFQSTHVLGWIAMSRPAACACAFFGDVVELDRSLGCPPYAGRERLAFEIAVFALQLAARKGYLKAITHARPGWEQVWSCLGARPILALKSPTSAVPQCTAYEVQLEPAAVVTDIDEDLSDAPGWSATHAVSHMQRTEVLEDTIPSRC